MPLPSALETARATLTGSLLLPSDDAFDQARRPWNLAIEQTPAAVAEPADIDDLRMLLSAARDAGATLAMQPSGHGASGDLGGAVILRMAAFDDLDVDVVAGRVRVGSGVRWGAVVDALEGTGWAAPAGTSPVVSVAGYTLGGGHSWFSRTAGLAPTTSAPSGSSDPTARTSASMTRAIPTSCGRCGAPEASSAW